MSKGVIWASEYSLGPQIWGPGGGRASGAPPGSATEKIDIILYFTFQEYHDAYTTNAACFEMIRRISMQWMSIYL